MILFVCVCVYAWDYVCALIHLLQCAGMPAEITINLFTDHIRAEESTRGIRKVVQRNYSIVYYIMYVVLYHIWLDQHLASSLECWNGRSIFSVCRLAFALTVNHVLLAMVLISLKIAKNSVYIVSGTHRMFTKVCKRKAVAHTLCASHTDCLLVLCQRLLRWK